MINSVVYEWRYDKLSCLWVSIFYWERASIFQRYWLWALSPLTPKDIGVQGSPSRCTLAKATDQHHERVSPLRGSLLAASAARFGPSALKVRSFWMARRCAARYSLLARLVSGLRPTRWGHSGWTRCKAYSSTCVTSRYGSSSWKGGGGGKLLNEPQAWRGLHRKIFYFRTQLVRFGAYFLPTLKISWSISNKNVLFLKIMVGLCKKGPFILLTLAPPRVPRGLKSWQKPLQSMYFFLSRLNLVQKETMWTLILYVVCT